MLMGQNNCKFFLPLLIAILLIVTSVNAATVQVPEWYDLAASLAGAPEMGKSVELTVKLKALTGDLNGSEIRLILPDSWKAEPQNQKIVAVKEGQTTEFKFMVTPGSYLSQGSIVVEAVLTVPQSAICARIKQDFPDSATGMIAAVQSWPAESKRYADISFALTEEESFYPLSGDMWLAYDDKLAPAEGFRGPVLFEDSMVTVHQAQTDVEMFEKLENYLKADPQLINKLAESGIDLERKRHDQLIALYVLAAKAYQDRSLDIAAGFLERFEAQIAKQPATAFENLKIVAANLRGLVFWAQGQRRLAEDSLKKAFYGNRKSPLQRYVLRNIGLLMLAGGDKSTAAEMFRLAAGMKQGYTLLEKEIKLVKN